MSLGEQVTLGSRKIQNISHSRPGTPTFSPWDFLKPMGLTHSCWYSNFLDLCYLRPCGLVFVNMPELMKDRHERYCPMEAVMDSKATVMNELESCEDIEA